MSASYLKLFLNLISRPANGEELGVRQVLGSSRNLRRTEGHMLFNRR